jgi:hypothetical protein
MFIRHYDQINNNGKNSFLENTDKLKRYRIYNKKMTINKSGSVK